MLTNRRTRQGALQVARRYRAQTWCGRLLQLSGCGVDHLLVDRQYPWCESTQRRRIQTSSRNWWGDSRLGWIPGVSCFANPAPWSWLGSRSCTRLWLQYWGWDQDGPTDWRKIGWELLGLSLCCLGCEFAYRSRKPSPH